ncbi:MAG: hypothetical protein HYY24_14750 [Verrucomicrobia bacterium]|nr:hypothetical protein [Verrucomicrobiota bacterium]
MKTRTRIPLFLSVLLGTASLSTQGQQPGDLPFNSGSTGVDGPLSFNVPPSTGRSVHAMAYDTARQQTVMFGGQTRFTSESGDAWVLDGTNWKNVAGGPNGRGGSAMAYDAARQQVLLFGGYWSGNRADTWVWDGKAWSQKSPTTAPSGRRGHRMAYDAARLQVVLFGGYTDSGHNNETWVWNGTSWTQRNPATSPSPRYGFDMVYDSVRQQIVLFGGNIGPRDGETWVWSGSNWTKKNPAHSPSPREAHVMVFDSTHGQVVLFGGAVPGNDYNNETWVWDGTDWTQKSPATTPSQRNTPGMAYDAAFQQTVLYGGWSFGALKNDTWIWDGNNWSLSSDDTILLDMTAKPNGVWNFTSITVPAGVSVRFKKNAANTPVQWLATENVLINGALDLNGANGIGGTVATGNEAPGGPGGFAGGLGGSPGAPTFAGTPGQGPGGGRPGTSAGQQGGDARYAGVYGTAYLQPLIGGSGGGGGAANSGALGGNGGGGGGAIVISSSRDITVNGAIYAFGGDRSHNGASYGGFGSGGGIRLVADRISGSGTLRADGGRIRLEGYYRNITGQINPGPALSAPVATQATVANASLVVNKVAGQNVAQPPTGNLTTPDVVFTEAGTITVTVTSQGVPDGTAVRIRVTTDGDVITAPPEGDPVIVLSGGKADIAVTVPKGLGTIQAYAEFTTGP